MPTNPFEPPKEVVAGKPLGALAIARRVFAIVVWLASALVLSLWAVFLILSAGDMSIDSVLAGVLFIGLPAVGGLFVGLAAWLPRLWCLLLGLGLISPIVLLQLFHELPGF